MQFPFPWPWPRKKDDEPECKLNPVLLIPGIGGSIIHAVTDSGRPERLWVRMLQADQEFRKRMWSKYNPETGRTESLDPSSKIEVPDDNHGLYAVDVLEPDLKVPLDMVNYYHNMIVEMRKWGYLDGKSLFGFGFDFRQSNRLKDTMEALGKKLAAIHKATGKKVSIVTHSMGGVLVKSYLALHKDDFEAHVSSWIAIASPFRGAPAFILDTLLTGIEFISGWEKDLFIAKWSMHQLLVECPSIYELLADFNFPWQELPELRLYRPQEAAGGEEQVVVERINSLDNLLKLLESALRDNKIKYAGKEIDLPLNRAIVEWALETKRVWERASIPEGVRFFNIYGTGLDTPFHAIYGSVKDPIRDPKEILSKKATFLTVDGDGTVPLESSLNDGMDAVFRVGVPGEHRGLLRDARVFRLVKYFLEVPELDSMYDPCTDFVMVPSKDDVESWVEMEAGFTGVFQAALNEV